MMFAFVIAWASVAPCQESPAEQSYKRIQEVVRNAKNLSVNVQCDQTMTFTDGDGPDASVLKRSYRTTGTLLSKDSQIRIDVITMRQEKKFSKWRLVSDGHAMTAIFEPAEAPRDVKSVDSIKNVRGIVAEVLPVSGIGNRPRLFYETAVDGQSGLIAQDFESIPSEGGKMGIAYKVKEKRSAKLVYVAKLLFDAQSNLVSSLSLRSNDRQTGLMQIQESYSDWDLHTEIPDDQFKLPQEKK